MNRKTELKEQIKKLQEELNEIEKEEYTKEEYKLFKDIEMKVISDKVLLVYGGLTSENPKYHMDTVISVIIDKLGNPKYNEFVEIHLDNPWFRVIVFDVQDMDFDDTLRSVIDKLKK